MSGVRVVKAFAQEERQLERFNHSVQRVFDQQLYATKIQARYTPMISFLPNLGLALILLIGGRDVIHGSLTIGAFTAFYAYLLMLISPMRTLGYMLSAAQRATASGARIFQVLDRAPRITAPADAPPLPEGSGRVSLEGVGLTFEGNSRPALRDIDLEIEAGSTVALVGAMGSGKTALVSLLPRLYEATTGSVRIDGADVRDVDLVSLRRAIAVVTDDPFLFSATVHDNIAYGRPDATREEVVRAAEVAQAAGFISQLPHGYETRVGERGLTLSGGQRQRIAIARAVLADPRILVLDDATSSVDASTEQEIKLALRDVMADRTTFVIAHRLVDDRAGRRDRRARGRADRRPRQPRGVARGVRSLPRDRREGHAGPGVHDAQDGRGGGTVRRGFARHAAVRASCAACSSCSRRIVAGAGDDAWRW